MFMFKGVAYLEVPVKRRGSPRPASQTCHPYRQLHPHTPLPSHNPGLVLPIFPFAPVRITEIVFLPIFRTWGLGFRCTLNTRNTHFTKLENLTIT
jgi:hypothetical protein